MVGELLHSRVPLPRWAPPRRRGHLARSIAQSVHENSVLVKVLFARMLRISVIVRGKEFSDTVMYEQNSDTEPPRTETNQRAESAPARRTEHYSSRQSARLYPTTRLPDQSELSRKRGGSDDAWQPREKESAAHQR